MHRHPPDALARLAVGAEPLGHAADAQLGADLLGRPHRKMSEHDALDRAPGQLAAGRIEDPVIALAEAEALVIECWPPHHRLPVGNRLGDAAVANPPQRIELGRVVARHRQVGHPAHQRRHSRRAGAERRDEGGAVGDPDELVGVERHDQLGRAGRPHPVEQQVGAQGLAQRRLVAAQHRERQAFVLQALENGAGVVAALVVEDDEAVEDAQVVAHEGFDDVAFVLDQGDADQLGIARDRRQGIGRPQRPACRRRADRERRLLAGRRRMDIARGRPRWHRRLQRFRRRRPAQLPDHRRRPEPAQHAVEQRPERCQRQGPATGGGLVEMIVDLVGDPDHGEQGEVERHRLDLGLARRAIGGVEPDGVVGLDQPLGGRADLPPEPDPLRRQRRAGDRWEAAVAVGRMQQAGGDRRGRCAGAGQRRGGADGMGEKGPAARSQDATEQGRRRVAGNPDLDNVLGRVAEPAELVLELAGGLGQGGVGRPHRTQRQAGALLPRGEPGGLGNEQGAGAVEPPLGGEAVDAAAADLVAPEQSGMGGVGQGRLAGIVPDHRRARLELNGGTGRAGGEREVELGEATRHLLVERADALEQVAAGQQAGERTVVAWRAPERRRDVGEPAAREAAGRRGDPRLDGAIDDQVAAGKADPPVARLAGQDHRRHQAGAGLARAVEQRRQPARREQQVVVGEDDDVAGRRREPDVAGLVGRQRALAADHGEAVLRRQRGDLVADRSRRAGVDIDQLEGSCGMGRQAAQRPGREAEPLARRNDDGDRLRARPAGHHSFRPGAGDFGLSCRWPLRRCSTCRKIPTMR